MSKAQERNAKITSTLRRWQKLERQAVETTTEIMEKTDNLLVRQIMEIIRNDSVQHHRVQQFLIDTVETAAVKLSREEMGDVWARIEEHDKLEREVIGIAKELKKESKDPVHKVLLTYLITDEEKHDTLLNQLDELKAHLAKLA